MKCRFPRAFPAICLSAVFALFPSIGAAGDVESWNAVRYTVFQRGRAEWSVGGALRVRDSLSDLYDRIFSTKLGIEVGKGVTAYGGYVIRNRDVFDLGTVRQQRLSASLRYPIIGRGDLLLAGETSYERYLTSPPISDYNRYRQRFRFGSDRPGFSPKFYQDFAVLQVGGLLRSRSRAGFQWASAGGYTLSVQYQFETINLPGAHTWHPRHAIVTEFDIDKPIWKSKRERR
jgi:hypothetical protein